MSGAFGSVRSVHRPSFARARRVAALALVLAFVALGAAAIGGRPTAGVVLFLVVLVPMLVQLARDARRRAPVRVVVTDVGVAVETATSAETMRFADVDALYFVSDAALPFGQPIDGALELRDATGRRLHVPAELERTEELHEAIDAAVTAPLVADALDALRQNEPMYFGAVRVDAHAMVVRDVRIPWTEVHEVRLVGDHFAIVCEGGMFPRATLRYDEVPHPAVLARVLDACTHVVRVSGPFAQPRRDAALLRQ